MVPAVAALGAVVVGAAAIAADASTTAAYPLTGKSSVAQPDCVAGRYAARRLSVCSHAQISTLTVRARTHLVPPRESTMRAGRATPPNSSMTF
jgi:hypothetical protein